MIINNFVLISFIIINMFFMKLFEKRIIITNTIIITSNVSFFQIASLKSSWLLISVDEIYWLA